MTIMYSAKFGDAMVDLCLENYYVRNIFWRPHPDAPLDQVGFGVADEEQNEAFETLQSLLEMDEEEEESERRDEEMVSKVPGPKRMEVLLAQKHTPSIRRHVVVADIMPPKGAFSYYSMSGRIKVCTTGKYEKALTRGMNDKDWDILQIYTFGGGYSRLTTVFFNDGQRQEEAWGRVATFYSELKESEKRVIENWDVPSATASADDDEDLLYSGYSAYSGHRGSHYYNRLPEVYKPIVAEVRVSGDEIGVNLYREQAEKQVQRPNGEQVLDICAYLDAQDLLEKKAKAEPETETASATTPSKSQTNSTGNSGVGGARGRRSSGPCLNCGSSICTGCLQDDGGTGKGSRSSTSGHLQLSAGGSKPTIH